MIRLHDSNERRGGIRRRRRRRPSSASPPTATGSTVPWTDDNNIEDDDDDDDVIVRDDDYENDDATLYSLQRRTTNNLRSRRSSFSTTTNKTAATAAPTVDWKYQVAQEMETVLFGDDDEEGDDHQHDENTGSRHRNLGPLHHVPLNTHRRTRFNNYTLFDEHEEEEEEEEEDESSFRLLPSAARTTIRNRRNDDRLTIYTPKYGSQITSTVFFLRIAKFLAGMFLVLFVVRILASLLTLTAGIVLLTVSGLWTIHELWTRPIYWIRMVHSSPIWYMSVVGATLGALHVVWTHHRIWTMALDKVAIVWQPVWTTIVHSSSHHHVQGAASRLGGINLGTSDSAADLEDISDDNVKAIANDSYSDLLVLWGLIRGIMLGIEMGSIWLIILGDSRHPSAATKYLYRRIWKPLKRYYKVAMRSTPQQEQRRHISHSHSHRSLYSMGTTTSPICRHLQPIEAGVVSSISTSTTPGGNERNRCAICLEAFLEELFAEDTASKLTTTNDRYQLLPCRHFFHLDCAREWLTIKKSCPVCRIPVQAMLGCSQDSSLDSTLEDENEESTRL